MSGPKEFYRPAKQLSLTPDAWLSPEVLDEHQVVTSLSAWENRRNRPSGETERPSVGGPDIRIAATVFSFPVAKLRNWMEDLPSTPGSGIK